jgi:hypothetical protein
MRNGGLASGKVRSQHHIFSPPLAWAKIAVASGLGVHTKPEPRKYKPKYDPIEFGREMGVAISRRKPQDRQKERPRLGKLLVQVELPTPPEHKP